MTRETVIHLDYWSRQPTEYNWKRRLWVVTYSSKIPNTGNEKEAWIISWKLNHMHMGIMWWWWYTYPRLVKNGQSQFTIASTASWIVPQLRLPDLKGVHSAPVVGSASAASLGGLLFTRVGAAAVVAHHLHEHLLQVLEALVLHPNNSHIRLLIRPWL